MHHGEAILDKGEGYRPKDGTQEYDLCPPKLTNGADAVRGGSDPPSLWFANQCMNCAGRIPARRCLRLESLSRAVSKPGCKSTSTLFLDLCTVLRMSLLVAADADPSSHTPKPWHNECRQASVASGDSPSALQCPATMLRPVTAP